MKLAVAGRLVALLTTAVAVAVAVAPASASASAAPAKGKKGKGKKGKGKQTTPAAEEPTDGEAEAKAADAEPEPREKRGKRRGRNADPGGEAGSTATAETVAVLPLQLEGDLNEGWQAQIEEALTRGFVQSGMGVIGPEDVMAASGGVGDCNNAKCFQFLSSSVDARFLVRAKLVVEERNYTITMDIVDGTDGSMAASSNEGCQLCGLSEVGDLVTTQAVALRQKVDMLSLEPAILAVTSDPSGATIYIDGRKIGPTPLEEKLSPGTHEAEARKKGYLTQTRTIDAVKGVRETLAFEMLADVDDGSGPKKDWKVPVGWTSLSLGIAGTAAGVTFLVLDERPYRTRCSGPDIDAFGNCRQRYGTLVHGAVFTASGGALLVTGAALLIAARVKGGRKAKEVARRVRLGPGSIGARF